MAKEDRRVKVYEGTTVRQDGYRAVYKSQPQIKLQGDWLGEYGFIPGTQMNIHCEKGKLVITAVDQ